MGGATTRPIKAEPSTDAQVPAIQETVLQGLTWENLRAVTE
jgi:hypothetical protein